MRPALKVLRVAGESPPGNEASPDRLQTDAEPISRRHAEEENSTPVAVESKPETEPESEFQRLGRERVQAEFAALNAAEDARLAALGPRARTFEEIRKAMGMMFEGSIFGIVQHVDSLDIQTEGGAVIHFKNLDDVLDPRRFEAAVNRSRVEIRDGEAWRGTRKEHLALAMKITRAATKSDDFADTDVTWSWIRKFGALDFDQLTSANERVRYYTPESRLPGHQQKHDYSERPAACWREGDEVLVHLGSLLQRLTSDGIKECASQRELATRLLRCGFYAETNQRGFRVGGVLFRVRVWANDLCAVPDLAGSEVDIIEADPDCPESGIHPLHDVTGGGVE